MPPKIRGELALLPTRPVRRGDLGENVVRLHANEVAFGPLDEVRDAVVEAAGSINRYPDYDKTDLIDLIAQHHGVEPDQVTVSAGSIALVRHLRDVVAGPGDEVVFATPSFPPYGTIALVGGAMPVPVPLVDFTHDLSAMVEAITPRTRMVIVCNPNNPTGTVVKREELRRFLREVPEEVLVVIDEAYGEFVGDPGVARGAELLDDAPHAVVLRTFSKAYGLGGLRLGYSISSAALAQEIRKVELPFGASLVAQAAGIASLAAGAQRQLTRRIEETRAERSRVATELGELGLPVVPSEANFVYLALGGASLQFQRNLADRDILVHVTPDAGVRVTVGSPQDNDRLLEAAKEATQEPAGVTVDRART